MSKRKLHTERRLPGAGGNAGHGGSGVRDSASRGLGDETPLSSVPAFLTVRYCGRDRRDGVGCPTQSLTWGLDLKIPVLLVHVYFLSPKQDRQVPSSRLS